MSYDSNIEESITRATECVLNHQVRIFKEMCEELGPDCEMAKEGLTVQTKSHGAVHYPTKFNVPLLRCIATGMIFDQTFAPPDEDYQVQLKDSQECDKYLDRWLGTLKKDYDNPNLQVSRQGDGLQNPCKSCPPNYVMDAPNKTLHPNLHPTHKCPLRSYMAHQHDARDSSPTRN